MATTSASCSSKYDSSSDITDFELEDNTAGELPSELTCLTENYDSENDEIPYSDEPLADAEWISQYDKEVKQIEEQESELKSRLAGTVLVSSWCKCGNCSVALLQNISECYCCDELDGCGEALQSDLVQDDVGEKELRCITDHPGFQPVCLEKWSLRLAADRYNTKSKTRYRQTGSENDFLRSVAYREFSRMVYGYLGKKRIPLPACAYTTIRQKFMSDQEFTGFDLDES